MVSFRGQNTPAKNERSVEVMQETNEVKVLPPPIDSMWIKINLTQVWGKNQVRGNF